MAAGLINLLGHCSLSPLHYLAQLHLMPIYSLHSLLVIGVPEVFPCAMDSKRSCAQLPISFASSRSGGEVKVEPAMILKEDAIPTCYLPLQ